MARALVNKIDYSPKGYITVTYKLWGNGCCVTVMESFPYPKYKNRNEALQEVMKVLYARVDQWPDPFTDEAIEKLKESIGQEPAVDSSLFINFECDRTDDTGSCSCMC